jgi:hypothetical protein
METLNILLKLNIHKRIEFRGFAQYTMVVLVILGILPIDIQNAQNKSYPSAKIIGSK